MARTQEEIYEEMQKVQTAYKAAEQKKERCVKRLGELTDELKEAEGQE